MNFFVENFYQVGSYLYLYKYTLLLSLNETLKEEIHVELYIYTK
jgi:hypothetical protein